MSFSHPDAVYSDACHWGAGKYPGPVDTVDGLVTALIEQRGWADVTAPSDISVDGYVGKAFQRTAPADMSDCTTRIYRSRTSGQDSGPHPDFRSWEIRGDFNTQYEPGRPRPCGSSTSTARWSSSARQRRRSHRQGRPPTSPPTCSTRSASSAHERRTHRSPNSLIARLTVLIRGRATRHRMFGIGAELP